MFIVSKSDMYEQRTYLETSGAKHKILAFDTLTTICASRGLEPFVDRRSISELKRW